MRRIGLLVTWDLLDPSHPGRDAGEAHLEVIKPQLQWSRFGAKLNFGESVSFMLIAFLALNWLTNSLLAKSLFVEDFGDSRERSGRLRFLGPA
jgi:hypothetical protein